MELLTQMTTRQSCCNFDLITSKVPPVIRTDQYWHGAVAMTMTNPESPWIARVMRTISCLALLQPRNTMAGAIQEGAGEDVLSFTKSCNRGMVSRIARSLPDSGEVARAFRDERPVFRQDVARGSRIARLLA
jgi:hypothetical protein